MKRLTTASILAALLALTLIQPPAVFTQTVQMVFGIANGTAIPLSVTGGGLVNATIASGNLPIVQGSLTGADSVALDTSATWNNAGTTFHHWRATITDTASAAGSLPLQILGGAAGSTTLLSVDKGGAGTFGGAVSSAGAIWGTANTMSWSTRVKLSSPGDGMLNLGLNNSTIGAQLKADALPTVSSGFGSSPSIVAKSTALDGAVNIGTGGVATSGVINFNGTAFTTAPFCVVTPSLTNVPTRPTTITTTQLTLTTTTAWTASDIVYWHCIGPNT